MRTPQSNCFRKLVSCLAAALCFRQILEQFYWSPSRVNFRSSFEKLSLFNLLLLLQEPGTTGTCSRASPPGTLGPVSRSAAPGPQRFRPTEQRTAPAFH